MISHYWERKCSVSISKTRTKLGFNFVYSLSLGLKQPQFVLLRLEICRWISNTEISGFVFSSSSDGLRRRRTIVDYIFAVGFATIIMKIVEMGPESSSNSNQRGVDGNDRSSVSPVVLNVYDLTPVNNYTIWVGFGIFHSGIEVHGKEYGFGAHDFPASGVFEVEPKSCPGFIFRCSISLGCVSMPPYEFRRFIESMAADYHGDTYHLISKNCNHFTDDISWRLTGKHIPGWVNRLARLGSVCSCLLPEHLQVTTVKKLPEYHECAEEDCTDSLSTLTARESAELDSNQEKHLLLTPRSSNGVSGDVAFIKESHK